MTPKPPAKKRAASLQWVKIPGGVFKMGSDTGKREERPKHRVTVGAFHLLKTEVTVGQYRLCQKAGQCTAPLAC